MRSPDVTTSRSLTTVEFAAVARSVADGARALGLHVPSFRSPPRLDRADRTIRRRGHWSLVSVRHRERPAAAVIGDLIEGVVVANRLDHDAAVRARSVLWERVGARAGRRDAA